MKLSGESDQPVSSFMEVEHNISQTGSETYQFYSFKEYRCYSSRLTTT